MKNMRFCVLNSGTNMFDHLILKPICLHQAIRKVTNNTNKQTPSYGLDINIQLKLKNCTSHPYDVKCLDQSTVIIERLTPELISGDNITLQGPKLVRNIGK